MGKARQFMDFLQEKLDFFASRLEGLQNKTISCKVMQKEELLRLIEGQAQAFIASVDANGFPALKAMLPPREHEGFEVFYFTTNTSSRRVAQYRANPKAAIYFCDAVNFKGVMLTGHMEALEDAASKQRIWREGDTLYYPLGVTDPDYCVLRFTAETGRFYSNFKSTDFKVKEL